VMDRAAPRSSLTAALRDLGIGLVAILFPPHCVVCEEPAPEALCEGCAARAARGGEGAIDLPGFDGVAFVGGHEGPLREAILALKFGRRVVVAPSLGRLLATRLAALQPEWRVELVVPVPSHPRRQRERGVNQTLLLARSLAKRAGLPLDAEALRRRRYTVAQLELTPQERIENLQGVFEAPDPARVRGRRVLLLDDVFTTGATLMDGARALRSAGAAAVYALTLSHGG
jgi:ComF family protein